MTWKSGKSLIYILLILNASCSDGTPSTIDVKESPKQKIKEKPKSDKELLDKNLLYITDKNAVDVFTNYFEENKERNFIISTTYGRIGIKLFEDTPIHGGNFLYLVKEKNYFDSTLFYRISKDFIIQGGDADNDNIQTRRFAIGDYSLPSEFKANHRHLRGAVGMSRTYGDNPDKVSSSFDFYIVVGNDVGNLQLSAVERDNNISYSEEDTKQYKNVGGTPHLDFQHTVFGELTFGMDVVEKISKQEADSREWPIDDIKMAISVAQD